MNNDDLMWAIKNGDLESYKKATAEKAGFDVNATLLNGRNSLHYAADYGQLDIVKHLCSQGANVDLPDKHGITPLLAAIYESHVNVVKYLVEKGAKKTGKGPDGISYIDSAETPEVKELLK